MEQPTRKKTTWYAHTLTARPPAVNAGVVAVTTNDKAPTKESESKNEDGTPVTANGEKRKKRSFDKAAPSASKKQKHANDGHKAKDKGKAKEEAKGKKRKRVDNKPTPPG